MKPDGNTARSRINEESPRRVLVAGATGSLGGFVAAELADRGIVNHTVRKALAEIT